MKTKKKKKAKENDSTRKEEKKRQAQVCTNHFKDNLSKSYSKYYTRNAQKCFKLSHQQKLKKTKHKQIFVITFSLGIGKKKKEQLWASQGILEAEGCVR